MGGGGGVFVILFLGVGVSQNLSFLSGGRGWVNDG